MARVADLIARLFRVKRSLGNLAATATATGTGTGTGTGTDHLTAIVKNRLKRIQYRPELLNGFLAQTGLTLDPEPP